MKVGLYRLSLLVSRACNSSVHKVKCSPIVELIRPLSKTDFRDVVDHSVSQTDRPGSYIYFPGGLSDSLRI